MEPFRWEIEGKQTYPLEHAGNSYRMKLEGTTVQFFENERKILEEDISDKSLDAHRDKEKSLEEQLLDWGRLVLETFFKECGVCKQQRMAFPLHLTHVPPEEAGMCRSRGIETICPSCVDALTQHAREKSSRTKQAFLRGEVKVFGGTDQELVEILQTPTGQLIQQFASIIYPGWNLGAIRFSDQRLYLALLLVKNDNIETFTVLVETQAGQITSMQPDTALEALGFQEGDDIQFLSFQ